MLGDHAIVHKPNRLYRMVRLDPPDYYLFEGIPADDGSISARGPISIGSYQMYPGRTAFTGWAPPQRGHRGLHLARGLRRHRLGAGPLGLRYRA